MYMSMTEELETVRFTTKGQVVIPLRLRKQFDIEDGTKAVGLFNRGELPETVTVKWSDLALAGKQPVRDLWREKDLGDFDGQYECQVPRHGVVLVRVGQVKQ